MEYKRIAEVTDLFKYCEELENAAEEKVKYPLISEIRIILKDLKVKQKAVDFLKFSLEDLIAFRDRLYSKMKKILSVNFIFKENDPFIKGYGIQEDIELDDSKILLTDGVEYDDYDFSGYRICENSYESRPISTKENQYSNSEELNFLIAIKKHTESYVRPGENSGESFTKERVINGCKNKGTDHKFSRNNLLYTLDEYARVCDDIKPQLIKVYNDNRVNLCNKNNLFYLLINGHIDIRLSEDMMNYLSKNQICELNDYFGTDNDPYPVGYCWLNLFDYECHDFLIENYLPFYTATEIFKILKKHPNILKLSDLDTYIYYYVQNGYGHFSFEEPVGLTQYEFSSNAYELLTELYVRENNFKDRFAVEEAKLRCMYSLLLSTKDFEDSYFASEYFTFDFVREEIFVFTDAWHKIVLRYYKI